MNLPVEEKTGKHRGFACIECPRHVQQELIKLNGIEFQQRSIVVGATSTRKKE